ncbi:MAG TPA: MarR family transcriptional regulator [Candidatus Portnoybacteria bacterium]|nr:MarR family transcriptional regulator [Candidatus Portnoybacteria bacterium]
MLTANAKKGADEFETLLLGMLRMIHLHLKKCHREDIKFGSPLQIQVLHYINERPKLLMKELAEFLAVAPPSVTSLVDSMAKDGLIGRKLDKADRRIVHLQITAKGKSFLQRGFKQMRTHIREIFAHLTEQERQQMTEVYKKIYNYFSKN